MISQAPVMGRFRPQFSDESDEESLELSIFDDSPPQPPGRETLTVGGRTDDSGKCGSQSSDDTGDSGDLIVLHEAGLDSVSESDDNAQDPPTPEGRDRPADTSARQDDPEEARTYDADGRPFPRAIVSENVTSCALPLEMINCKRDALAGPSDDANVARGAPDAVIARPTKKSKAMVVSHVSDAPHTVSH
jgi:hypothetical protein